MSTHQVGSALVLDGDRLVGIFTERDVLRAVGSDFDAEHHPVAGKAAVEQGIARPRLRGKRLGTDEAESRAAEADATIEAAQDDD